MGRPLVVIDSLQLPRNAPARSGVHPVAGGLVEFAHLGIGVIDLHHPLARLAGLIDWARFEEAFDDLYTQDTGRPGLPTRLMAGLHLVKHIKGLSDEAVCAHWLESPHVVACEETKSG